jgi:UDP-glucuronate 4-epimerase
VSLLERYANIKARINYLPVQPGDANQTFADISKSRGKLNYNPMVDIESGLEKYVKNTSRL